MTGPEHYREAEDLLAIAAGIRAAQAAGDPTRGPAHEVDQATAEAQVHALLALAAATALGSWERNGGHDPGGMDPADRLAWEDAASVAAPMPEPDDPRVPEWDPGPEVDDEGGMSEYRYDWPAEEDYR